MKKSILKSVSIMGFMLMCLYSYADCGAGNIVVCGLIELDRQAGTVMMHCPGAGSIDCCIPECIQ